jgi:chlorite dismutase
MSFFSLVGIRGDSDFMIFADSEAIEPFQSLVSSLLATSLGKYLDIPYSYLAMTRESPYLGSHRREGQEGSAASSLHSHSKYLFVYPFVKKREWYGLPLIERRRIMADHFKIGHGYPDIKIHTAYSFGLDDQEFMLAFEGDDASEFLALVEELRSSEASRYTQLETPIFTCVRVKPERMLQLIG